MMPRGPDNGRRQKVAARTNKQVDREPSHMSILFHALQQKYPVPGAKTAVSHANYVLSTYVAPRSPDDVAARALSQAQKKKKKENETNQLCWIWSERRINSFWVLEILITLSQRNKLLQIQVYGHTAAIVAKQFYLKNCMHCICCRVLDYFCC